MMDKQIAIIKKVGYGCRDVGYPVLFFSTMISESSGALQVLSGEEAACLIKAYGVWDVKELEGKPIWVTKDGSCIRIHSNWSS